MSKTKVEEVKKVAPREAVEEEEKTLEPDLVLGDELVPGEVASEEEEDEDGTVLDDEEVDPFKDKWEE